MCLFVCLFILLLRKPNQTQNVLKLIASSLEVVQLESCWITSFFEISISLNDIPGWDARFRGNMQSGFSVKELCLLWRRNISENFVPLFQLMLLVPWWVWMICILSWDVLLLCKSYKYVLPQNCLVYCGEQTQSKATWRTSYEILFLWKTCNYISLQKSFVYYRE